MSKELLDWKLDFHNPSLGARFDKENGKITIVLTRITILMVMSLVFMPFLEHFLSAHVPVFSWERYSILYLTSGWLFICFFLSFVKPVLKHVNLFANLVYFFFILILGIGNIIVPKNYVDDSVDASALALILGAPIVLSLKTKYWLPFSAINVLINVIDNIYEPGYMFEKRSKYLFFRQVLVDIEASKLHWAVARDASLLQNIFPKNLSDELERQMSTLKRQKEITLSPSYINSRISQQFFSSIPLISAISNIDNQNEDNDNEDYNNNNNNNENNNNNNLIKSTQFNTDLNASLASMLSDEEMIRIGIIKSESEPVSVRKKAEEEVELLPRTLTGNFLRQKEELQKQLTVLIPPTPKACPPSVIFAIPPVITTPSVSSSSLSPPSSATYLHENVIISSGTALQTPNQAEVHTFLSGAQHIDGSCIALSHSYPSVSIIFADIVGFTTMSSSISPQDLVKLLNEMFTKFDEIIDYHHLEKIRTVGDAYLCVGNMTIPLENHMEEAIAAGLKMITAVATVRDSMHLRVGIATGSIIAGVTGLTKWNYDIFGQSVAEACHQETLAPPDHVAVTQIIYEQCKNKFNFVVEPDSELFLVPGSRDEILPAELSSFHQSEDYDLFSFLDLPQNRDPLFHAVNNIAYNEIMENFIPNISEEMDLSFNFEDQFGYTREDVEQEEALLTIKTSLFPFKNLSFRAEYQIALVDMVHDFTKKQCILFGIGLLFFMVSFILVSPSIVLPTVIIIGCAALVFFAYTWYAKHYDYHPLAGYVALAVVSTGISSFVAV